MIKKFVLSLVIFSVLNSPSDAKVTRKSSVSRKPVVVRTAKPKTSVVKTRENFSRAKTRQTRPRRVTRPTSRYSHKVHARTSQATRQQITLRQLEQTRIAEQKCLENLLRQQEQTRIQQELLAAQRRQAAAQRLEKGLQKATAPLKNLKP